MKKLIISAFATASLFGLCQCTAHIDADVPDASATTTTQTTTDYDTMGGSATTTEKTTTTYR